MTPVTGQGIDRRQPGLDAGALDVAKVRADFPILDLEVNGKTLVYLDSAATAQKPAAVIDAVASFYRTTNANIHRGVHHLSVAATEAYERARARIARHLGAADPREIVFVRGATEGVNLVAQSFARPRLEPGDEIVVTTMEHHSNIVPWQLVCEQTGAVLRVAPIDEHGEIVMEAYERLLTERTRIAAFTHVSNSLGTINDVRAMASAARRAGATVVVDGAQAVPHMPVNVADIDCDFYVFSGHKAFAPTGIGALYGRLALLECMPPYQGGGEMIRSVTFDKTDFAEPPARFEAGTPNIAGAIGLAAAIDYLDDIGFERIAAHEADLLAHGTEVLSGVPGLKMYGTAAHKAAVFSFTLADVHAHDIGTILDGEGIAVRTGHHCTQPVMDHYGIPATTRASLAFYNTREEIDRLAQGLIRVAEVFGA